MKSKITKHFSYLILILLLLCGDLFCQHEEIGASDKKKIEALFQRLVGEDTFGYTLFFDKPVAFSGYYERGYNLTLSSDSMLAYHRSLKSLWLAWEKHSSKYRSSEFLFFAEKLEGDYGIRNIFLINKKAFIKIVDENKRIFSERLNRAITGEGLLQNIERERVLLPLIDWRHDLLGILLGYGVPSSKFFQQIQDANSLIEEQTVFFDPYNPPTKSFWENAKIGGEFLLQDPNLIREKEAELYDKIGFFSMEHENQYWIDFPVFLQKIDDPETEKLIIKYSKQRDELCSKVTPNNVTEKVLERLKGETFF